MAEFNYDKKREHEKLAAAAIDAGELDRAYFHVKEAVKYTMVLAARCGGKLGQAYVANASGLLDVAEKLKGRLEKKPQGPSGSAKVAAGVRDGAEAGDDDMKKRWTVEKNTGVRLDDVKGLADAKAVVRDAFVNSIKYADIYEKLKIKFPSGMLLYGPPGTGKTMFARAIAGEMDTVFMHVKMSDLKSKYVGETERNVAEMFAEARSHARCILFIDECESLLRTRGNQKVNAVESFLVEMDGVKSRYDKDNRLFLLFATNRPWLLDSAITRPGRIGNLVYVGLPDAEARESIIRSALKGITLASDVDIGELVAKTEGYSGAELHHDESGGGVCDQACLNAAHRWIMRREAANALPDAPDIAEPVSRADFIDALASVIPTSKRDADIIRRNLEYSQAGHATDNGASDDME